VEIPLGNLRYAKSFSRVKKIKLALCGNQVPYQDANFQHSRSPASQPFRGVFFLPKKNLGSPGKTIGMEKVGTASKICDGRKLPHMSDYLPKNWRRSISLGRREK